MLAKLFLVLFDSIVVADNAKLNSNWFADSNEFAVPVGETVFLLLLCLIYWVIGVLSGENRWIVLLFELGRVGGLDIYVGSGGLIVGCLSEWECAFESVSW